MCAPLCIMGLMVMSQRQSRVTFKPIPRVPSLLACHKVMAGAEIRSSKLACLLSLTNRLFGRCASPANMCYPFIDRVPPFRAYLKTSMLDDHLKQPITVGVLPRHGQAFGRQLPAEPSICDKLKTRWAWFRWTLKRMLVVE